MYTYNKKKIIYNVKSMQVHTVCLQYTQTDCDPKINYVQGFYMLSIVVKRCTSTHVSISANITGVDKY